MRPSTNKIKPDAISRCGRTHIHSVPSRRKALCGASTRAGSCTLAKASGGQLNAVYNDSMSPAHPSCSFKPFGKARYARPHDSAVLRKRAQTEIHPPVGPRSACHLGVLQTLYPDILYPDLRG
ncbi:unnamed protein product [Diplocarpon coronariae]